MATRPTVKVQDTLAQAINVYSGATIRKGFPVRHHTGTTDVEEATAITDNIIGIARDAGDSTGATGLAQIVVYRHGGIVPVLVGTGGATAGLPARLAVPSSADGVTDATVGGGTGKVTMLGEFVDTGVAGDYVGMTLNINHAVGS